MRSHSLTRGYDANKAGKDLRPRSVPVYNKNKDKVCPICNNRNAAGRPVVGHLPGDPVCPKVQSGETPQHPRFDKVKQQFGKSPDTYKKTAPKPKKKAAAKKPFTVHMVEPAGAEQETP